MMEIHLKNQESFGIVRIFLPLDCGTVILVFALDKI